MWGFFAIGFGVCKRPFDCAQGDIFFATCDIGFAIKLWNVVENILKKVIIYSIFSWLFRFWFFRCDPDIRSGWLGLCGLFCYWVWGLQETLRLRSGWHWYCYLWHWVWWFLGTLRLGSGWHWYCYSVLFKNAKYVIIYS